MNKLILALIPFVGMSAHAALVTCETWNEATGSDVHATVVVEVSPHMASTQAQIEVDLPGSNVHSQSVSRIEVHYRPGAAYDYRLLKDNPWDPNWPEFELKFSTSSPEGILHYMPRHSNLDVYEIMKCSF